jgi:phage FluMu protein Com
MKNEKVIYQNRLLGLTMKCPECGTLMTATGKMHYDPTMSRWFIEYWCPRDQEMFPIYTPETDHLTRDIAKDVTQND